MQKSHRRVAHPVRIIHVVTGVMEYLTHLETEDEIFLGCSHEIFEHSMLIRKANSIMAKKTFFICSSEISSKHRCLIFLIEWESEIRFHSNTA